MGDRTPQIKIAPHRPAPDSLHYSSDDPEGAYQASLGKPPALESCSMSEPQKSVDDWLNEMAQRMQGEKDAGAAPIPETLTVREFLAKFGNARRGHWVVSSIRQQLERHHLRTSPDFQFEYIDNPISIERDDDDEATNEERQPPSPIVRVSSLTAAHTNPVSVAPDDPLAKATTVMWMEDYSQLPVMTTPREVRGVVSWRSIGKAYADGRNPENVRECMEEAHTIDAKTTLADATYEILKHDYVLVRGEDKVIAGIVTAADLADQFRQLAHPFLLIGEIEYHLRNLVRGKFTVEEFTESTKGENEVKGPDDLTFGGYCRLLERREWWEKLKLNIDRKELIRRLEIVRIIRNDVMHFSPDGIELVDVKRLEQMAEFLRELGRSP